MKYNKYMNFITNSRDKIDTLLVFLIQHNMIEENHFNSWFDDNIVSLELKYTLLTFCQNDIDNMLDDDMINITQKEYIQDDIYPILNKYICYLIEVLNDDNVN